MSQTNWTKTKKLLSPTLEVIALIVWVSFLLALPTMLLWNWLMPGIFGLVEIGYWQAMGLNLLSSILFKSAK